MTEDLAYNGDTNRIELPTKMSDVLGIVLIPTMAAECELGLLVVLKGNEALELTVGRYLAIGTFWYQQPMTKCPGTLYIELLERLEIKDAKLPGPVEIL